MLEREDSIACCPHLHLGLVCSVTVACSHPVLPHHLTHPRFGRREAGCPCCWHAGAIRKTLLGPSATGAAAAKPAELKALKGALNEARSYKGCRIWRRFK